MKITEKSHVDHGFPESLIRFIAAKYEDRDKFFIDTFVLPVRFDAVPCALHEGVPEEECFYAKRGKRVTWSRMCARPLTKSNRVTVIGGMSDGECILFTAYGGPLAPREPGDPDIATAEEAEASFDFWRTHALSACAFGVEVPKR